MDSITIDINNCNNIVNGRLNIKKDVLNIKYGMNGTGKSTLATALEYRGKGQSLEILKAYGSGEEEQPTVTVSGELGNVLVFNEDFVNTLVFQKNTVIENAFDVFIKTSDYDTRRATLDERLKTLKVDVGNDERIIQLQSDIQKLKGKLELTAAGNSLKTTNSLKSILKKDNLFKVPTSLQKYSPLLADNELSINWIDWKTKGEPFDEKGICPFCSDKLEEQYTVEKAVFKETYKKADSQNLKTMLDLIVLFEKYLAPEKHAELMSYIKNDVAEETIKTELTFFIVEFNHMNDQLEAIQRFDSNVYRDIKDLDKHVSSLKILKTNLKFFTSLLMLELVDFLNSKIELLGMEITGLKADMGKLRTIMQNAIQTCSRDMNIFLKSAGIQYEVDIKMDDDGKTMAILQYRKEDMAFQIDEIRKHLSWGERNAFALVLFMFYALSQNPDLIVLDDPISSFDSNKKYAIIHRLFAKSQGNVSRSFYRRTVLMLTHDFEPIIDFVVVGKLAKEYVSATFIRNNSGNLGEITINNEDIKPVIQELLTHICDEEMNKVHRITSLRKYYEHHGIGNNMDAYNVLSSLIHGRGIPAMKDDKILIPVAELGNGITDINKHIPGFDYDELIRDYFSEDKLVTYYFQESNSHLKLQLFRTLMIMVPLPEIKSEDTLLNFINESYHIENDYAYYLNVLKFDMVPTYIVNFIDDCMKAKYSVFLEAAAAVADRVDSRTGSTY